MAYSYFILIIGKSLNYIVLITNILSVLTTGFCKCIMPLNDEGNKMQEEGKDVIYMEKKWPAYIAILIICIPVLVVLGFAQELSENLWSAFMSVLTLIVPMILAWIIGYMDDAESHTKNFRLKKAIINTIIVGVLCGVSLVFTDTICAVVTIVMAAIIAFRIKNLLCEYREMKDMTKFGTDDQDNVE